MQGADEFDDATSAGRVIDLSAISPAFDPARVMPHFAPEVHIHPTDEYLPASVDWYLERTQLRFHRRFGRDITILTPGHPGVAELVSQTCGQELSGGFVPSDFYLQIASGDAEKAARKGQGVTAECYVHARSVVGHPELFDLQYWFFYPFNGTADRHTGHEGDWEHLTVRVSNTPMPEITLVYYSAHSPGQGRWVPATRLPLNPDQRPIAYSARSSHASYAGLGAHMRTRWKPVDNTAVDGPVWDTSATLVLAAINGSPLPGNEWLGFSGRWGKLGRWWWKWEGHGPRGPAHQASWYRE